MQACVDSGEGAMAAIIGLTSVEIEDVIADFSGIETCQIANDNDPKQVVISGQKPAVEEVIKMTKKKGARRALLLNVSAPFHCSLMRPAAEIMQDFLSDIVIMEPRVPIVMNTRAKSVFDTGQIRTFLVDQIIEMVRWRESIEYMYSEGVTTFYELGAGKVLSGMVKRTVSEAQTVTIYSQQDILSTVESLKNANYKK